MKTQHKKKVDVKKKFDAWFEEIKANWSVLQNQKSIDKSFKKKLCKYLNDIGIYRNDIVL